ncbi:MAG: acetate kinase [Spirochaetes bacterium]|nr:acetate kinase [Spirochaetota bacterium]
MKNTKILVINCGSSSLKYQLISMPQGTMLAKGNVERIGDIKKAFIYQKTSDGRELIKKSGEMKNNLLLADHKAAFQYVIEALIEKKFGILNGLKDIDIVAHRVVHGGEHYRDSVMVTKEVLKVIEDLSDLAPLHNPANVQGIRSALEVLPGVPQTATFDTAFHQTIPEHAYRYALPTELYEKYKIRKYGFHGTSHRYVANQAVQMLNRSIENTNLISCHLGNGCSITAIAGGKSVDTSMGFTPLEGLMMGTRCGDIDPAIIPYLVMDKGYNIEEVNTILNKCSGALGLFEKTNDMRDIVEAAKGGDKKAQLTLDIYTYRIKKYIGAYCALLIKVDALIFTGGVGQNSWFLREMICKYLQNIGIHLDKEQNKITGCKTGQISFDYSPITILVVPTNEEQQMAMDAYQLVGTKKLKKVV